MTKLLRLIILIMTIVIVISGCGYNNENVKVPILMYHHLVTQENIKNNPDLAKNGSVISVEKFTEQMKYLHENSFNTITLQELTNFIEGKTQLPPKPVVLTFDDGYESNYTLAYPVLKKYNHKATINIVVRSTEKPIAGGLPHLTWEQMREMQESGLISIQSHTYDLHKYLPVNKSGKKKPAVVSPIWLKDAEREETQEEYQKRLQEDFSRSKNVIENKLGTKVNVLCFPYGVYNDTALEIADGLGYEIYLTIKKGYNTASTSLKELYRFGIAEKTPREEFIEIVSGKY
ncbi:MAG: Cda1 [Clostridiales bacterium]|nr:Cda1 [Clostridiales bacterium]